MNFDEIVWRIKNEPEWVILIGLLLIITVGGGGYYLYQRSQSQDLVRDNFSRALTRYNLADRNGNYPAAAQSLRRFVNQYPNTNQIDKALFFLGKSYYEMAEYSQAIKQFRRIVNQYEKSEFVDAAQINIGYAQLRRNNPELALNQFRKIASNKASPLWEEAVWQKAIVHKIGGDTASAKTALDRLTKKAASEKTYWTEQARRLQYKFNN